MYNYKNIVKILKSNQITAKNDFKNIDELKEVWLLLGLLFRHDRMMTEQLVIELLIKNG